MYRQIQSLRWLQAFLWFNQRGSIATDLVIAEWSIEAAVEEEAVAGAASESDRAFSGLDCCELPSSPPPQLRPVSAGRPAITEPESLAWVPSRTFPVT